MKHKISIGSLIFYPTGGHPYDYKNAPDYSSGSKRAAMIKLYHDTKKLPMGVSVWDDYHNEPLKGWEAVNWSTWGERTAFEALGDNIEESDED